MASTHLLHQLRIATKIRRKQARSNAKDLDTILRHLVMPVQHEHVQCDLAASVPDHLKVGLLRPASLRGRSGKVVLLGCPSHLRQARHEDQAWIAGLQEQWHEGVAQNMGACDVHVVGLVEAVAKRDVTLDVLDVEGQA